MNNIIVYIETENGKISDVSLELLTKGRSLANDLSCKLEALLIGKNVDNLTNELFQYGAEIVHIAQDSRLEHYLTLPYSSITIDLFKRKASNCAFWCHQCWS
ncbi:hypothetical protein MASR2M69_25670 [Bacteroidota bacterium]